MPRRMALVAGKSYWNSYQLLSLTSTTYIGVRWKNFRCGTTCQGFHDMKGLKCKTSASRYFQNFNPLFVTTYAFIRRDSGTLSVSFVFACLTFLSWNLLPSPVGQESSFSARKSKWQFNSSKKSSSKVCWVLCARRGKTAYLLENSITSLSSGKTAVVPGRIRLLGSFSVRHTRQRKLYPHGGLSIGPIK